MSRDQIRRWQANPPATGGLLPGKKACAGKGELTGDHARVR